MQTEKRFQWLPTLLNVWNLIDITVHIAVDEVEPLRIMGNFIGIAAAGIVRLDFLKLYQPYFMGLSAAAVVILNSAQLVRGGFAIPMLIFIGMSVFLLLRLAQIQLAETNSENGNVTSPVYHRWWVALVVTLVGLATVALVGEPKHIS